MMPGRTKLTGQAIIEYSLLAAIFIAAVVAMQIYLKRSFQGYLKQNTDRLSSAKQFSSAWSNYTEVAGSSSKVRETITPQGETRRELLESSLTTTQPYVDNFSDKKLTEENLF
jgi:Flp pilus assembly pilin Flp